MCRDISFWRGKPCVQDFFGGGDIRCRAGHPGQCAERQYWGVKDSDLGCKDGSDLYRPIAKAEATNSKCSPSAQENCSEDIFGKNDGSFKTGLSNGRSDYSGQGQKGDINDLSDYILDYDYSDGENPNISRQSLKLKLWETKPLNEREFNRVLKGTKSGKQYKQDTTIGLWIRAVTRETCAASDGFVSSVRSSYSHPDLILIHHPPTPLFSDHTGPQHWTFTF